MDAGSNTREEELRLLNDEERADNNDKSTSNETSGTFACVKNNFKLILGVLTILTLVVLGVVVGALSNSKNKNLGRLARAEFSYKGIRLPKDVIPLRYRIYLHPNLTTFKVQGATRILINCQKATKKILFHFKDNTISRIKLMKGSYLDRSVKNHDDDVLVEDEYRVNTKKELIMVKSNKMLEKGQNYTLVIHYNGTLRETLQGFYKSTYKTKSGETRYIATTHFEPATARTAFPCFDEPEMKATFRIIIVRSKEHNSTSNMPLWQTITRNRNGVTHYVDYFNESVRMSTYLVAFVIHDFKSKEAYTKSGIKIRVIAPADQIDQADFAIQTAPKVLDYYEEFFQVKFPLPKQDMIAIPDFAAGAMENWGLVTYRMTSLLYNKKVSSESNKQWVAVVIAHEFAHQWFGNLVTMKWWNDLWLNEGFAAYMENIGVDHVHKTWGMMDQFSNDKVQRATSLDAHADSHPISVKVKDPKEIASIFDYISYDKGACIIRMLKDYIGTAAFHKGLQNYLKKYKFSNAVTDQLWECFSKASGKDVKSMMDTWIKQMGFPLVTFKRDPTDSKKCYVTQKHFLLNDAKPARKSPYGYKWDIPLTYKTSSVNKKQTILKNHTQASTSVPCPGTNEWIKMNIDSIGFYRVNYDVSNWKLIEKQLLKDHTVFSVSDRSNIIDDIFNLAKAEEQKYNLALGMTQYFKNENSYTPWESLIGSFNFIALMLQGKPGYAEYEKYIRHIIKPQVLKLGWKDTGTHLEKFLRSLLLYTAVKHNETNAVKNALKLFNDYKTNGIKISPNLKGAVYFAGVRYGTNDDWMFLWKEHEKTVVSTEKRKIETALTNSKDPKILKMYLKWSLDPSKIKTQESVSIITGISANEYGEKLAWDFTLKNWDVLYKRYSTITFALPKLISHVFGKRRILSKKIQAVQFFKTHETGTGKRASKQAIESIKNHVNWVNKHEKEVADWFKAFNKKNEATSDSQDYE